VLWFFFLSVRRDGFRGRIGIGVAAHGGNVEAPVDDGTC
jgi:hypothetical protein